MKEIPASELIQTLLDGAPSKVFDFVKVLPNGERALTKLRLRVLRVEENHSALKDAQDYAKERGELEGYGDIYREAQAVEVLARALCHVKEETRPDGTRYYPRLFTEARHLRMSFNETEMAVLLNCYQITKSEFGALESLDEHSAEEWIARLSDPLKGNFFLSQLDSLHWPACISLLAGTSRDLCQSVGVTLPSLEPTSVVDPPSSPEPTGSSSLQPSASSTDGATVENLTPDQILTREEARARVNAMFRSKA